MAYWVLIGYPVMLSLSLQPDGELAQSSGSEIRGPYETAEAAKVVAGQLRARYERIQTTSSIPFAIEVWDAATQEDASAELLLITEKLEEVRRAEWGEPPLAVARAQRDAWTASHQPAPEAELLIAALREHGIQIDGMGNRRPTRRGAYRVLNLGKGQRLHLLELDDELTAESLALRLDKQLREHAASMPGSTSSRFLGMRTYQRGRLLVQYHQEDIRVVAALSEALGPPITESS